MNTDRNFLEKLLASENIVNAIRKNMDRLVAVIPEIKDMVGFEHKSVHHHLDVWEHTLLALSFSEVETDVRLILLLHDIGKPHSFQDAGEIRHFKGHPIVSEQMSRDILERLGYAKEYIDVLCEIIREHDNMITDEEIKNVDLATKVKFKVQICDALAHNPDTISKRLTYIQKIKTEFNKQG